MCIMLALVDSRMEKCELEFVRVLIRSLFFLIGVSKRFAKILFGIFDAGRLEVKC